MVVVLSLAGPDLAGTEEAGDDGGGDTIVGRDQRLHPRALLRLRGGSRGRREPPVRSPRRRPRRRPRCRREGVGARGGAQAQAEEGRDPARGRPEGRRRGDGWGGGAERRHGARACEEGESLRHREEGKWIFAAGTDQDQWRKKRSRSDWGRACWNYLGAAHARVGCVGPRSKGRYCHFLSLLDFLSFVGLNWGPYQWAPLRWESSFFFCPFAVLGYINGPPALW